MIKPIPQGYKQTKVGVIPDDWEVVRLIDGVEFLDHKRKPLKDEDRQKIQGQYPYYGASGIIDHVNDYIFEEELILIGEDGANIIDRSSRLVFLANGKYWVNNHAHVLKAKKTFNNYFLCEYLESLKYEKHNTGTAQPKLNKEIVSNIPIIKPPIQEQEKIADILSIWDDAITKQEQLIKQKQLLKKGLMQQIFSQKLRFHDDNGNNYPAWETNKLGDICNIDTGKLDANAMEDNGKYRFYTCAKEYYFINEYAFDTDALLISGNGANVGYIHHYNGRFNAYQRTYILDHILENIIFIKYQLDQYLHVRINAEKNEGNTPYIVRGTLSNMDVLLPFLEEQTKIANFLTSIDDEITKLTEQLKQLQLQKKGLMQQLLTGKVRVKV
jgi:type I restriction enzyme S subunit